MEPCQVQAPRRAFQDRAAASLFSLTDKSIFGKHNKAANETTARQPCANTTRDLGNTW